MTSKAHHATVNPRPGGDCATTRDRAVRSADDDAALPRVLGLAAACVIVRRHGPDPQRHRPRHAAGPAGPVLLTFGIAGLLFHAAFDRDVQFRRVYMLFGYVCLVVGAFLAVRAIPRQMGGLFGHGFLCLFLGLLFLLAFLRNETDAVCTHGRQILAAPARSMAVVGLVGGNIKGDFLRRSVCCWRCSASST